MSAPLAFWVVMGLMCAAFVVMLDAAIPGVFDRILGRNLRPCMQCGAPVQCERGYPADIQVVCQACLHAEVQRILEESDD